MRRGGRGPTTGVGDKLLHPVSQSTRPFTLSSASIGRFKGSISYCDSFEGINIAPTQDAKLHIKSKICSHLTLKCLNFDQKSLKSCYLCTLPEKLSALPTS